MQNRTWLKDCLLISFSLIILFGAFLGTRPLGVPDEARYSEIPREMIELNDYLTPHLNYIKYFEKPPLLYWLQAGSIKAFGLSEWAVRFPTALLALIGCLMVYASGRTLYDRRTGLLASFILATSLLYFAMAHLITLDMTVTTCLTACLLSFILALQSNNSHQRRILWYACYTSAALGVLAKGLIGIVLPGLIVFTWLLIYNQWRILKTCHLPSGLLLFSIIAFPWYIMVQQVNPEFFHFFFIEQHFSRYLTLSAGRYQPGWFFIAILLLGFFPWTVFLFQAIYQQLPSSLKDRHANNTAGFLILWAILILVFFSLSKSKLIPYILPIFPPLALLTARYLSRGLNQHLVKGIKLGFGFLPVLALGIAITLVTLPYYQTVPDIKTANIYLWSMAGIILLGSVLACLVYWRKNLKIALVVLIITSMLEYSVFNIAVPYIDTRSIKPLAETLRPILKSNDEIASYGIYFQDLPFYLRRKVTIVGWTNELTFGMQHQDTKAWMITTPEFGKRWQSAKTMYAVMAKNSYDELRKNTDLTFYLLAQTMNNVLVSNRTQTMD